MMNKTPSQLSSEFFAEEEATSSSADFVKEVVSSDKNRPSSSKDEKEQQQEEEENITMTCTSSSSSSAAAADMKFENNFQVPSTDSLSTSYLDDQDSELASSSYDTHVTISSHTSNTEPKAHHHPLSTNMSIVEESNLQVSFCEMTVQEMNQILEWWNDNTSTTTKEEVSTATVPSSANDLQNVAPEDKDKSQAEHEDDLDNLFPHNSLLCNTHTSNLLATGEEQIQPETFTYISNHGSNNALLIDDPLPQDVSFFSPFQSTMLLQTQEDPEEIHRSAQKQQEQVTRLIFRTQDMAEQVAFLTETSESEHEDDTTTLQGNCLPADLLNSPRTNDKLSTLRRRRKSTHAKHKKRVRTQAAAPSICKALFRDDHDDEWMELKWSDRCWLFAAKQLKRLEANIVSLYLVSNLPLPLLLYLLHRPKMIRIGLIATILTILWVTPILVRLWFPARMYFTHAPFPSLDVIQKRPYHASEWHYAMHAPTSYVTTIDQHENFDVQSHAWLLP